MSYSIVFETKFIKLSDGRLLHLDRSGCNNDNAGRDRGDFTGKIYTEECLSDYAMGFINNAEDGFALKIGSKQSSYSDYGKHLLRMAKRALPYDEFCKERYFSATRYDGVELLEPEERTLTPEEFSDYYYNALYGGKPMSYRRLLSDLNTENEIVDALENNHCVSFYVGKKY